ncbi:MAG: 4-(cytidine 5'-diphospho)-2-C-methyl-D-erythritol kinase [Roseobacter sp.]
MSDPVVCHVFAPAKINLTLHVTGRRDDGYHLLDSVVAFADVGDDLVLNAGELDGFSVEGPEAAGVPADDSNLICKVGSMFANATAANVTLIKNLPTASGIGGGSADAAAAFRGFKALQSTSQIVSHEPLPTLTDLVSLGADIPMCVASQTARVSGIGDMIDPLVALPEVYAVLVNPRREVATPDVFKALQTPHNARMPDQMPRFSSMLDFVRFLMSQRNDLEEPALRLAPAIDTVKRVLASDPGCMLARMSGSGATCFGLFETRHAAQIAAEGLRRSHPNWWVKAAVLGSQTKPASARIT